MPNRRDVIDKLIEQQAQSIWERMSENEQFGVRVGLIPLWAAEELDEFIELQKELEVIPEHMTFPATFYQIADNNGGMVA